jgi:Cu/Ag efflux protein CusF
MKAFLQILVILAALVSFARAADEKKNCGCACCKGKEVCCCHAGDKVEAPAGHPLKGVVIDVVADKKSLLVKHEEIPGVMKAMTMLLRVDEATLASVKKGDAITATLTNEDGAWWLREVKPAAAK